MQRVQLFFERIGIPANLVFTILTFSFSGFFLLLGYECVRSISDSLIVEEFGSKERPLVLGGMVFFALIAVYIYNIALSLFGPRKTLLFTCFASMVLFTLFMILSIKRVPGYSLCLYYLREVYIVLIIEQFWSFADSVLSTHQSMKLFGIFIGISSFGAVIGGSLIIYLTSLLGTENMLIFPIVLFIPIMILINHGYRSSENTRLTKDPYLGDKFGLAVLLRSRYLVFLACLIGVAQILAATLNLNFFDIISDVFTEKNERTIYVGKVFLVINSITMLLNFIVTPIVFKYVGISKVHLFIPLVQLISALWMFFDPSLAAGTTGVVLFKTLDYSLFRAGRELLYIPLSFNERFRAKQFIDTFIYRTGKAFMQLTFGFLGYTVVILMSRMYSITALLCVLAWIILISLILSRYNKSF